MKKIVDIFILRLQPVQARGLFLRFMDKFTFRIILTQGLNRQIRRMCEYFGYRVMTLERVRVMNIKLGRLKTGGYRNVTDRELEDLKKLIANSSSQPCKHDMME